MKKQILFIAMFMVAMIFAETNSYGQVKPYEVVLDAIPGVITPQTLAGCTASELKPIQGVVYTYTVVTTDATDDVRWFVYNDGNLGATDSLVSSLGGILPDTYAGIDDTDGTGDYILNLGTTFNNYNDVPAQDGAGTDKSIEIAWKYFDGKLPNEVLLVAYVEDDAGCANNIAVYRIIPQPSFTIDVAVLSQAGDSINEPFALSGTISEECVSPIESAVYVGADNTTPNGALAVDYGENWVYFAVNGANYIDSWLPAFQISYDGGSLALEAEWNYASAANTNTGWVSIASLAGVPESTPVMAGGSGNPGDGNVPAAGGEQIVVRVRIDYGTTNEHDGALSALHFAVDGVAYDGVGANATDLYDDATFGDLHYADCATDGFTNDKLDYNILPRPQVEEGSPQQETKTGEGVN